MRLPLLPRSPPLATAAVSAGMPPHRRRRCDRPPPPPFPPVLSSTPPPTPPVETPKPENLEQRPPPSRRRLPLAAADAEAQEEWHPLPLSAADLSLPLTLPTGQSFLWRRTSLSPLRFTGAVGPHLLSLSHLPDGRVAFLLHNDDPTSSSYVAAARASLFDYLNAAVPLADLWRQFTAADARFAEVAARLGGGGARVLRQDPVECVFQFLCSSNNNVARIEKMVWVLAGYGERLGEVGGFVFHRFPTIERLARVSEQELREAGFGYRAKYIVGTAKELKAKPGGGEKWLASLRERELPEVIEALCTLPGVGPKVAACIALFSLDQNHAIPVDTHVWKDIWCHIHSLMPMRDAARVACLSRAFLRSWRCHPNLTFSKEILGLNENVRGKDEIAKDFTSKVECILKNHSGIGVKTLQFQIDSFYNMTDYYYLNSWLRIAVTPGIEELTVALCLMKGKYNFPCSLLSDGTGDSIRYLHLVYCDFRPTVGLVCLRSLTRLHLCDVRIMGDELGCILSNTLVLERLELRYCKKIICVKIPCLQRLSYLEVVTCIRLQVIESKAPNLSSFRFAGDLHVQLSLGETLQVKNLDRSCSGAVCYARAELPSSMPNLETLTIHSGSEMVNTPMVPTRFLHLKFLSVALTGVTFSPNYDYFSLVSFLDASPSLETFILTVLQ